MKYLIALICTIAIGFSTGVTYGQTKTGSKAKKQTSSKSVTNQTPKEVKEIEFLGTSIDQHIDNFVKHIKLKGFKLESDLGSKKTFIGSFSGYPNCKIIIDCQPKSKTVRKIEIQFPDLKGERIKARDAFERFSNQYKNKYSKIATIEETGKADIIGCFTNRYYTDNVKVSLCFIDSFQNSFVDVEDSFSIVILNQKVIDIKETDDSFSDDI